MGHIFTPPLDRLAEHCAYELGLETFVETGTFRGESAGWAAERFVDVITIERKPEFYAKARDSAVNSNIAFHCGHSPSILPTIVALPQPKLFWLDAHWCGEHGESFGREEQCPIADELTALQKSTINDIIMIDDFHMFALPPPEPFRAEHWPSLDEIFALTRKLPQQRIFVVGDAIVLAGGQVAESLAQFFRFQLRSVGSP